MDQAQLFKRLFAITLDDLTSFIKLAVSQSEYGRWLAT